MPGLSQLKKFNADILSLGNEPALRASRGEKPVTVPIPKGLKDVNDSDDFLMGMPEPVENVASENQPENVPEDFSDIMGTENSSAEQKNADSGAAPQINLSVPDISTIASGDNNDSVPDLSMFDEPVQQSAPEEPKEAEPEKEPEIADLSLEDLLGGEGFDGTQGKDDSALTENENPDDDLETLQEVENISEAEPISEPKLQDEPKTDSENENSSAEKEKSVDELIAQASGKAEENNEQV